MPPAPMGQFGGPKPYLGSLVDVDTLDAWTDALEVRLARATAAVLPPDWTTAELWFSIVGDAGYIGIQATTGTGEKSNLRITGEVIGLLNQHKLIAHDPDEGTWFSGQVRLTPDGFYRAAFSDRETPSWVPAPTNDDYRREFERFPRDPRWTPEDLRHLLA
ncbi:hypothetical protein ACWIGI_15465 [Nocardia sp. NPDC055321]